MDKFKLNKKHSFIFVVALLLFSLNLNTFAATSTVVHFADTELYLQYGDGIECTNSSEISSVTVNIDNVVYNATIIVFDFDSLGYKKQFISNSYLNLYTNTNYTYNMYVHCGANTSSSSTVVVYMYYYLNGEYHSVDVFYSKVIKNGSYNLISGTYKTPNISGNVSCAMLFVLDSDDNKYSASSNRWTFTDLIISIDDPLINGTPINTPSTEELENTLNEYNDVMGALPQVDNDELEDLMNFDFDSFTDGMTFVREMFERTMNTFGFNAVLVFGLTVGLATYIIGRKVG